APNDLQAVRLTINGGRNLPGSKAPYQLVVRDTITDVAGNRLDGDFFGFFPSGNGQPGTDFVANITTLHNVVFSPLPTTSTATPNNPPGTPGPSFILRPSRPASARKTAQV